MTPSSPSTHRHTYTHNEKFKRIHVIELTNKIKFTKSNLQILPYDIYLTIKQILYWSFVTSSRSSLKIHGHFYNERP